MNKDIISTIKKLKLKDAGYKMSKTCMDMPCESTAADNIVYPNLYLNSKNAPDLKGYEPGDEVTMVIKGKVTGHDYTKRKNVERETFDIEINKLSCLGKK